MKKIIAMMLVFTLVVGMTMTVSAEISPQATKDSTQTVDKADTAPKTGESGVLLWGVAFSALLAQTAVVAKKKMDEAVDKRQ